MLRRSAALALLALCALALTDPALGGEIFIGGWTCYCDVSLQESSTEPNLYGVTLFRRETAPGRCDPRRVAFRIQGVPSQPQFLRRFEAFGTATGDPFGEGAIVELSNQVYDVEVGVIWLYLSEPLAPQVWSVEAHQGIPGVTTPAVEYFEIPGVWSPDHGSASTVGNTIHDCDACIKLPRNICDFPVEPATWSLVKQIYR